MNETELALTIVGSYFVIGIIYASASMEITTEKSLGFFAVMFICWPLSILMVIGLGIGKVIKIMSGH